QAPHGIAPEITLKELHLPADGPSPIAVLERFVRRIDENLHFLREKAIGARPGAAGRGGAEKAAHQGCGKENSDESRAGETIHGLRIRRNPEESSGEASRLR